MSLIWPNWTTEEWERRLAKLRSSGGPGSGNFGHAGRKGEVGGSGPGGAQPLNIHWMQPVGADGRPIPIKVDTVEQAIPLILDGKVVELPDVKSVGTVLERLAAMAEAAAKRGEQAPRYDLCQVSVPGTNLFCSEKLRTNEYPNGVPRIQMPQLSGRPVEGSDADKLPRNPWDHSEVDGSKAFIDHLMTQGIPVQEESVLASHLRASQGELVGPKVAAMMLDKTFDVGKNPIFISRDNYIVDGHHRWAALVGRDAMDGKLTSTIPAHRIDAPISEVLHYAHAFANRFGIQQAEGYVPPAKLRVSAGPPDEDTYDLALDFVYDMTDEEVIAWARLHAAELVTQISNTSIQDIREAIADVLEGELSDEQALGVILAAVGDEARARTIAANETMKAASEGQRTMWDQAVDKGLLTGNEKRVWITAGDDACDDCKDLEDEEATLDGEYPNDGGDGPPLHVNCRCTEGIVS